MISKFAAIVGGVGGLLLAFAIFQLANTLWLLPAARDEGRALERADALNKSMELIQKRSQTNAEIRNLDSAGLCVALGGRWVPEDSICE
ncbi:hypothetical protein [Rhizobium sp. Root482]|uniref:hypothetical protein n=1 Tax=Rhizobium sp. Root482 TaxID=1736543 RepID=UPI0006F37294|nr:hypothetical protein [Rhizobium sp. Root482]KQY27166.1 hypothetical protein ASD31_02995 [Rhizobium sp. Root482]